MASLDTAWLNGVIRHVQDLSLGVITTERAELPSLVRQFTQRLEPAPDPLHNALLANVLLDVCRHTFESLHASQPYEQCACAAEGWTRMMRCVRWYESDPRVSLCAWIDAFVDEYARNHPPSVGTRAAEWLRRDPATHWTITDLARRLGVTRRTLRIDFVARFGIRPSEYLHAARVTLALTQFDKPWKIEALAYEVGYRSKKDLYLAFKRWTGLTPNAARALPAESHQILLASMRARCLWGDRHRVVQPSDVAAGALGAPTLVRLDAAREWTQRAHAGRRAG